MRQILFQISLGHPWSGWHTGAEQLPVLGAAWVLLIAGAGYLLFHFLRGNKEIYRDPTTWIGWGIGVLAASLASSFFPVPETLPIFGYGMMVLLGFTVALTFVCLRAKSIGVDPNIIMDSAFWILISGVAGGRLAYLIQYRHEAFRPGMSLPQMLFKAVNLSEGGLVLLGALVGGGLGAAAYFWSKRLRVLEFCDLLIPAVFIGVGFGRIGCLLNGCCFGDRCDLPWGISFPKGSTTFTVLMERGFVSPDALATFPLHPTQIYSSIDGFLLALATGIFYWYRKHPGDVLAAGCMLYSVTRFLFEFLRADEMGQLGTGLTISQLYSIGIFTLGLVLMLTGPLRGPVRNPMTPTRVEGNPQPKPHVA
ncbi:prolipoprotein diacylglyceryl transferase [Planctomicrobium sp. SH661]|uniref:prolipoprotein diacylglyceryl transferase n=1 Tax=Planctomicrobium sp. SH661 TaxID=3448124 RepID=UPI003F5CB238